MIPVNLLVAEWNSAEMPFSCYLTSVNNTSTNCTVQTNSSCFRMIHLKERLIICSWVELFWFLIQQKELVHMSQLFVNSTTLVVSYAFDSLKEPVLKSQLFPESDLRRKDISIERRGLLAFHLITHKIRAANSGKIWLLLPLGCWFSITTEKRYRKHWQSKKDRSWDFRNLYWCCSNEGRG